MLCQAGRLSWTLLQNHTRCCVLPRPFSQAIEPASSEFNVTRNYLDWCASLFKLVALPRVHASLRPHLLPGDFCRPAGCWMWRAEVQAALCGPTTKLFLFLTSGVFSAPRCCRLTSIPWGQYSQEKLDVAAAKQVGCWG